LDPSNISARYLLALALLETGDANHAANELARMNPESNPGILLLQARIARQIHDPATEIASLEALLKITRKQKQSATGLYLFLGQAWARRGFSDQALENYKAALHGELTEVQRAEVLNAMSNIRRKTEKSSGR
jgi:tetratricopeptide (TPR) repeat protein